MNSKITPRDVLEEIGLPDSMIDAWDRNESAIWQEFDDCPTRLICYDDDEWSELYLTWEYEIQDRVLRVTELMGDSNGNWDSVDTETIYSYEDYLRQVYIDWDEQKRIEGAYYAYVAETGDDPLHQINIPEYTEVSVRLQVHVLHRQKRMEVLSMTLNGVVQPLTLEVADQFGIHRIDGRWVPIAYPEEFYIACETLNTQGRDGTYTWDPGVPARIHIPEEEYKAQVRKIASYYAGISLQSAYAYA